MSCNSCKGSSCKNCKSCQGCSGGCDISGDCGDLGDCSDCGDSDDSTEDGSSQEGLSTSNKGTTSRNRNFTAAPAGKPMVLTLTQWLDSSVFGNAIVNHLKITGRRLKDGAESPGRSRFVLEESLENLVPGNGPFSITKRIKNFTPGFWRVSASLVDGTEISSWSGLISRSDATIISSDLQTNLGAARFANGNTPGIFHAGWSIFVGIGVIAGLAIQILGMMEKRMDILLNLIITALSLGVGYLTAKVWFVVKHRKPLKSFLTSGICIQGFLGGWSMFAALSLFLTHTSIGNYFDVSSSAIFVAMALGRIGCFFSGCCTGAPTSSPWGVWSSDGKIGTRRIPTQLMESFFCLVIGLAGFLFLRQEIFPGSVFIVSWIMYTGIRALLLFPLRAESLSARNQINRIQSRLNALLFAKLKFR